MKGGFYMSNTLGGRISELRKQRNITQDCLAEAMSVSPQAVSKWENDISCPDIMMLPQLAEYINVTVDELLRGNQAKQARMMSEMERQDTSKMLMKVIMKSADGDKIKVNLPMTLVKMGVEMGMMMPQIANNDAIKDIDFGAIIEMVDKGLVGEIVDMESAGGDTIKVIVE